MISSEPNTQTSDPQLSLSALLLSFWRHLAKRRKSQIGLLLMLMLVSALSDVISIGAVLPFISVLTAPEKVFNHSVVKGLAEMVGITSPDQLVTPLALVFALAAIVAGAIRLLLLWATTRLSNAIGADISIEIYRRTLFQPYSVHVARNSSDIIAGISSKSWVALGVLQASLSLISSAFLLVAMVIALVAIDPFVISLAMIVFGVTYGLIAWASRRELQVNSQHLARESTQIIKALQEGLGGIRDVLINGTQLVYCDTFRRSEVYYRKAYSRNVFIGLSPRHVMETIGLVLIAGLAHSLSRQTEGVATGLPVLGALALGAQRLLPAIQQIYSNWVSIVGNQASLTDALKLLDQPLAPDALSPVPPQMEFQSSIQFAGVRFRYSKDGPWVLDGLNLTIPKGARIGFVGSTGSGKSTTLDLLMGLLEPTEGEILVDGQSVSGERRRSWQQAIAHVPQSIFLADTTLAENIAFGFPQGDIDMKRVRSAAQQAQIARFIESRPDGYNAYVGERGIRLSGGQRQRIGIARALYKQAAVLVFDEATSSLDNVTEQAIMDSIECLTRDLTILIIAHRLTTVERCDQIVEMGHGRVVAQGSYEQLLRQSPSFRNMALVIA